MDGESSKGGTDPNQKLDEERARGEDPRLANLSEGQNKGVEVPAPFKVTSEGK